MKKLLLTIFTLTSFYTANSQVVYSQNFESIPGPTAGGAGTYTFPPGFLLRNVDNRTPATTVNYVNEAWERREDFKFSVLDSAAFSTSWYSPAGAANDWMWTPLISNIPANAVLSWNAVAYDASYPDGYEVRIMTVAPTGGAGAIGNQITNSTVLFSIGAENTNWTSRTVSLNSYAGQNVYIGFRNNSTDQFVLLIDDIKVEVPLTFDAQLVSTVLPTEYTLTPITQASPLNFSGSIRNNGTNALTNVMLNVDVRNSANVSVYTASSTPAGLASGATSTFTVAPFTPATVDSFSVKYYVSATEGDLVSSNDTLYKSFETTDTTYARDSGIPNGSLGIGAGVVGYIGQEFQVVNTDDLTSVTMAFIQGYAGRKCAAVIWDMVAGVPNAIVASTDTILYPDDNAFVAQIDIHGGAVTLAPGSYVITAVEFDSTLTLALTDQIFTTTRTWVQWAANPWRHNEYFGSQFSKSYILRANFGINCVLAGSVATATSPSCNNATDGMISVSTTGGTGALTYSWSPNVSTTNSASSLSAGTYTINITDSENCPASVTVTLNNPTAVSSIANPTNPSCNGSADGSISLVTSGGSAPYTYSWIPNVSTGNNASNLVAGSYTITSTDANGCTGTTNASLTNPADITGSQTLTLCAGETVTVGTHTYGISGVYTDTIPAVGGCDSIITTNLTVNNAVDVTTSLTGATVSANATGATYQWLDCDNGNAEINGETGQSFSPAASGNYAVVITENSCTDTSACVSVTVVGIAKHTASTESLNIYPNPNAGNFVIKANAEATYTIYNELGQTVKVIEMNAKNNFSVSVTDLSAGVYTISGISNNKVIKQKIVIKK
ncbi:MAG TPA: choice-of-anchor J domain-containing protein [Bacteroidia bacterium]